MRSGRICHVQLVYGEEPHHVAEAIFKALAPGARYGYADRTACGGLASQYQRETVMA